MKYLAFNIGCIECGEDSSVIGIFDTKEEAKLACDEAADKQAKDWHGQHRLEVFELPTL